MSSTTKLLCSSVFFLLFYLNHCTHAQSTKCYTSTATNQTSTYPCQTYIIYRAAAPDFLDLASIADLFSVSRLKIAKPSNISSPSAPLIPGQQLFVPITCSCNNISYGNLTYTIQKGDTFRLVSSQEFQNLTTYQSVEAFNPTLIPTQLEIGVDVIFPIFCKCPQSQNEQVKHLISYVFQPSDTLASVATTFKVETQSIIDANGNTNMQPYETIFIPVRELPQLPQPAVSPSPSPSPSRNTERKGPGTGPVLGLAIGLGIIGFLLVLVSAIFVYRELFSRERCMKNYEGNGRQQFSARRWTEMDESLMVDVSDCLDRFKVFKIEELKAATDEFADTHLIEGSVYKGYIGNEIYAIKRMKWNAYEELKILQKVNHGNILKLEGFCIDPEDAKCYLVYEYLENGSLDSWLFSNKNEKLSWRERLRIAVDIANGLQYIHEHTRPQVVHKDIKSSNILLDANIRAKIANFGLAKSGCNAITMHIVGTQGYIAPEYIADGIITTKMDVFSFGVVLLELISGKEAIDEQGKLLWASACRIFDGSEERKPEKLKNWMDEFLFQDSFVMDSVMSVLNIAIACVHKDPSKRPSTVEIGYALCKNDELMFDASEDGLSSTQVTTR